MSNKKYSDFTAGSYNTSKIFLQADATTGALEKVNLPIIPAPKIFIFVITANSGGVSSSIIMYNTTGTSPTFSTLFGIHILINFGISLPNPLNYIILMGASANNGLQWKSTSEPPTSLKISQYLNSGSTYAVWSDQHVFIQIFP